MAAPITGYLITGRRLKCAAAASPRVSFAVSLLRRSSGMKSARAATCFNRGFRRPARHPHPSLPRKRGRVREGAVRRRRPHTGGSSHGVPDKPGREILESATVKATYDARTDTLTIILKTDSAVAESDEDKPGIILDYDQDGNLVSLEILDASKRVTEARRIEFETTG
jgi:uncharacterized protein YuzE